MNDMTVRDVHGVPAVRAALVAYAQDPTDERADVVVEEITRVFSRDVAAGIVEAMRDAALTRSVCKTCDGTAVLLHGEPMFCPDCTARIESPRATPAETEP